MSWLSDAVDFAEDVVSSVVDDVSDVADAVGDVVGDVATEVGNTLDDVGSAVVDVITNIGAVIVDAVESTFGLLADVAGWFVGLVLSIPIIGRAINLVWKGAQALGWGLFSWPDAILWVVGVMPEKRLRVLVVIQSNEAGMPISEKKAIEDAVTWMRIVFKREANIKVLPAVFFGTRELMSELPPEKFIETDSTPRDASTLDVCCELCAFGNDLVSTGGVFERMMNTMNFSGAGRRLLGYGSPLVCFAVRRFTDGKGGCSVGPTADYITVDFNSPPNPVVFGYYPPPIANAPRSPGAPLVAHAIPNQVVHQSSAFTFAVPADTFTDPDSADALALTASLADGTGLPAWLTFNPTNATFSGTPPSNSALSVKVTAKDKDGNTTYSTFDLLVANSETTLAHECAHACNLLHVDFPGNLMTRSAPRQGTLTKGQKLLMRVSRHVTYL